MLPKSHFILGFLFSLVVFLLFPDIGIKGFVLIWSSSVLIDVDHYLFYVFKKKDLSLKNAYRWFIKESKKSQSLNKKQKNKLNPVPCIFHGIEFMLILIIFSLYFPIIIFIIIGFLFHEFLDFISLIYRGYNLKHIMSQTYNIINYKNGRKKE